MVLGAGRLAQAIVLALPFIFARERNANKVHVVICSRSVRRAEWLATLGRSRLVLESEQIEFSSLCLDWSDSDRLAEIIAAVSPTVILHTASHQSVWSLQFTSNEWSRLVLAGGYGVTAALQAALLPRLGFAIAASGTTPIVVNACYPDLVNAGREIMGVNILCGLGNVALLAEVLRQRLDPKADAPLRVLAGHWDVLQAFKSPDERIELPRVWLGNTQIECFHINKKIRLESDPSLNSLSAVTSASLLNSLITDRPSGLFHVPGPFGLPGGYPCSIQNGSLRLNLPKGLAADDAISWNDRRNLLDGAVVRGSRVEFSEQCASAIAGWSVELSKGFDFGEVSDVASAFLELRRELGGS